MIYIYIYVYIYIYLSDDRESTVHIMIRNISMDILTFHITKNLAFRVPGLLINYRKPETIDWNILSEISSQGIMFFWVISIYTLILKLDINVGI